MTQSQLIQLGIGILIALQSWTLKELYNLRISLTRREEKEADHERRISALEGQHH